MTEFTIAIIKPGVVKRKQVGQILQYIESLDDVDITFMRKVTMSRSQAVEFYKEHEGRPYFDALIDHTVSGPCVAMVLTGEDIIRRWRNIQGPADCKSGLRFAFHGEESCDNGTHGSDSQQSAWREAGIIIDVNYGTQLQGALPTQEMVEVPQARFLRIHPDAVLPTRAHDDDAGWDFRTIEGKVLYPGHVFKFRTGWKANPPPGYELQIRTRSGLGSKGICVSNSPGTVDPSYTGEMFICLINNSNTTYEVNSGDAIAQIVPRRLDPCEFIEVSELPTTKRGESGFGSTGR
jgi:dUTP pyrophosphatase